MNTRRQAFMISALLATTGLSGPAFAVTEQDFFSALPPREQKIDKLRSAEIHQLQLVLSRSGHQEMQPDLMLRLAELYTEKYKLYFFRESEIWGKKMDTYLALPLEQQKGRAKPVLDSSASRRWLGKAVDVLRAIPAQKISYSRIDEVYYFLAFNEWELGRKKDAVRSFQKIVDSYPSSKFSSEAHRYVADFAFAARDFGRAVRHYQKAAQLGDTPTRPRILYGLAWAKFKLQDYRGAVNTMRDAIRQGRANEEAARAGLALQRDAAESLALFYSEGGNVDEASSFFTDLFGEEEGSLVLRKLSEFYQRQGKYAKALAVNKQLLALGGPAARQGEEQRFEIMVSSLNVASSRGDRARQAALLKAMTAEFVTGAKAPAEDKAEILRAQVRKAAALAHKEGNKSNRSRQAHERAEDLYRIYLSSFGSRVKSEDAAEVHWYLADVLNQLGKHQEAVGEYRLIIEQAGKDPAYGKYKKDASSAMVYAMDQYFKGQGQSAKKLSRADGDQVIAAIDAYVQAYPDDKSVPKYLARAAGILVTSGRMEEARPRLVELADKHPRSKEAWDAVATLMKDAEKRKDHEASLELAQRFLANGELLRQDSKGELRKSLESVVDRSRFRKTQELEAHDPSAAAAQFEKTASSAKDPEVRAKALNNAAVNYGRAGDRENELRVYGRILQLSPGNDQAERALLGIAHEHFLSGRYSEAAEVYEGLYAAYKPRLASLRPSSQKDALESLRSAALLRRALGQGEKAGEDFRELVDAANKGLGPAREAAGEFLFDTALRQRDEERGTDAIRSFQKYGSAFPDGPHSVGAKMETASLYAQLREEEKAQSYYRAAISKVKGKGGGASPEELGYAARARLELLAPLEEAFQKAPLRLPEKQLQADIKAKLRAMEQLNKGYVEVMDFGDGQWGVEAFRRMAMAYRDFGTSLERAPVPKSLSPEDKAKFKAQLKGVAAPVFLKVGETLDTALQKGEQLQVVGAPMARTYVLASVNSARPDRLPLLQAPDWSRPSEWLMGEQPTSDEAVEKQRSVLRAKAESPGAWIAIGNRHALRGEWGLAEIFYLHVLQRSPRSPAALNNLAYLRGRDGDLARAMGGFKAALGADEFAVAPKRNIARLFMGAGLWRHASLSFRQLEVRLPGDREVKRASALAALAMGRIAQAETGSGLFSEAGGENARFAEAVLALGKGNRGKAAELFTELAESNEYARLILDFWKTKEND